MKHSPLTESKFQFIKKNIKNPKCRELFCEKFYPDRKDGIPEMKFGYLKRTVLEGKV